MCAAAFRHGERFSAICLSLYFEEDDIIMDWITLLHGIIDTAIYCLLGIIMMGVGIVLVILLTPFSVKKEIEDDQNVSLGIIIGAVILGIAIIIAGVVSSPGSDNRQKNDTSRIEMKTDAAAVAKPVK
jgi:putative membrane protein